MATEDTKPDDLEAPLLQGPAASWTDDGDEQQPGECPHGTCSALGGVSNLVVTAVGAGMLALPKAFATVGIGVGLSLFVFVCLLTYLSTSSIVKYASADGSVSYGDLIKTEFGEAGAVILQLAIIIHVFGVMVSYLIIIADMLVGAAPDFAGVLPTMLHRHDDPWFLSRPFVVAVLVCGVVAPMLIPRSLTAVARFSRLGVLMILSLAATIFSLAVKALAEGKEAPDVHVLPRFSDMGDGSPLGVATALLTVVSVACFAATCHFNLINVHKSLKDPKCNSMLKVLGWALVLVSSFYATVASAGYVLFGSKTDGDVLKNLNINFVSSLVPPLLARVLINGVTLGYAFNLLVNFVLKVWALRENVSELAFDVSDLDLPPPRFYRLTFLLVGLAFGLSVVVPSIYLLISLVGSTACVTFSYIFPGLLLLRKDPGMAKRACAVGMLGLGSMMAAIAVYNQLTGQGSAR